MAVVWAERGSAEARLNNLQPALEQRKFTAKELEGAARKQALKDFQSGAGWYRGAEVDRLSENEAGIIAARLVGRIGTQVSLSDEKTKTLQAAFTDVFKRRFTRNPDKPERTTQEQRNEELLKVGREHLDDQGIAALKEAIAKGYRPAANEK